MDKVGKRASSKSLTAQYNNREEGRDSKYDGFKGGLLVFQHLMDHMARSEVSGDGDELNTVLQQSAMK